MLENFPNLETPLSAYVGAVIILYFSLVNLIVSQSNESQSNESQSNIASLLAILNAVIAILIIFNPLVIVPWPSVIIILFSIRITCLILEKNYQIRDWKHIRDWKRWKPKVKKIVLLLLSTLVINSLLIWYYDQINLNGVEITAMLHEEVKPDKNSNNEISFHTAMWELWEEKIAEAFEDEYGVKLKMERVKSKISERYDQFQDLLGSDVKPEDRVDILAIDIIWPNLFNNDSEELSELVDGIPGNIFFQENIDNNTVNDKLVALPWYVDVGLLFYRKDLLGDKKPPETWDELEQMARDIQTQERQKGNKDFWGFVWEGADGEGLTCVALEWQASYGGGQILNESGREDFDIEATTRAVQRAKSWIGDITPNEITKYTESDVLDIWKKRNALFMRHWPYAYNVSVGSDDPPFKDDEIGVTLLPRDGKRRGAKHVSTLGGWQLMVNKHSSRKQKQAAKKLVEFLSTDLKAGIPKFNDTSPLVSLIDKTRKIPALKEVYSLGEAKKSLPYISNIPDDITGLKLSTMLDKDIEMEIVERPSKFVGETYLIVSNIYSRGINKILSSKEKFKNDAIEKVAIETKIKNMSEDIDKAAIEDSIKNIKDKIEN